LEKILKQHKIGDSDGDFIITPISCPRSIYYDDPENLNLLPDLVLPPQEWETKVAVRIAFKPHQSSPDDTKAWEIFETLFSHALYLPTQVVIVDCSESPTSQKIIADIVNKYLKVKGGAPLVLFRVKLGTSCGYNEQEVANLGLDQEAPAMDSMSPKSDDCASVESGYDGETKSSPKESQSPKKATTSRQNLLGFKSGVFLDDWARWNALRQNLTPDGRVGVCLSIEQDIDFDFEALQRWTGEPIRMITIGYDRFVTQPGCRGSTRLTGRLREFVRSIMLANSFMTSLVVQAMPGHDMQPYVTSLSYLCANLDKEHPDYLRAWNDTLMTPLQPLAINLDSRTYQIFELDRVKYLKYQEAMAEALDMLMMRSIRSNRDTFNLMVLGAGRGPLVDAMIEAIVSLKLHTSGKKFKLYALDKNNSSVVALRYKQAQHWSKVSKNIQTEVVKADMRFWQPEEKADIIATELLGSLSDNELSPECIEGTWKFSNSGTISIPEAYTSYIAPICSFKMHQELFMRNCDKKFDQIYVVRLANIYTISEPKPLFTFEHKDLGRPPVKGANLRSKRLTFTASTDTTCHGFAGYFSAKLFGSSIISTVPSFKTQSMDSWFPAYVPLEEPILLSSGSQIEVSFSRKESDTHVWYEWFVIRPQQSRIHSLDGEISAMSKNV